MKTRKDVVLDTVVLADNITTLAEIKKQIVTLLRAYEVVINLVVRQIINLAIFDIVCIAY